MSNKKVIQKVIVAGVIIKDNKVLIIQRNKNESIFPNMWELPSGKKDLLEKTEKSLLREVKEETGLDISIIMPFSIFDYQIEKENETRDSVQINFLVKSTTNNVKLSSEHRDFKWIESREMNDFNISENTKKVLKEAFSLINLLE